MANFKIGPTIGNAKLSLDLVMAYDSKIDMDIGEGRDMSVREIKILERDRVSLDAELETLRKSIATAVEQTPPGDDVKKLEAEVTAFHEAATKTVEQKKWQPVSLAGIFKAAAAIGAGAVPVVEAAKKAYELFKAIHG